MSCHILPCLDFDDQPASTSNVISEAYSTVNLDDLNDISNSSLASHVHRDDVVATVGDVERVGHVEEELRYHDLEGVVDNVGESGNDQGDDAENLIEKKNCRKRKASPSTWKQNVAKRARESGEAYHPNRCISSQKTSSAWLFMQRKKISVPFQLLKCCVA